MDRFLCLQTFVRVAETRSFAEAARQLNVARPVITQRISQLEEFMQSTLFHRSTRSVQLSEAGAAFPGNWWLTWMHCSSAYVR